MINLGFILRFFCCELGPRLTGTKVGRGRRSCDRATHKVDAPPPHVYVMTGFITVSLDKRTVLYIAC